MPTVKIGPKFERCRSVMGCVGELWNYDRFYIHEGYHSYLTEEMAKGRMYSAEIGIFEIPVGATVYINYAYREVVSTDIKFRRITNLGDTYIVVNIIGQIDKKRKQ